MNLTTLKDRKQTGKEIKTQSWNGVGLGGVQLSGIQTLGREGRGPLRPHILHFTGH